MYDLILCVLTTTKSNRLSYFSKIGYKQSSKYKTKVVYLAQNEERPSFINENEEWYNCNFHYTFRFLDYLRNCKEEFRWIIQVDDDSCTDLDKTVEFLDNFYDYHDSLCLGSFVYHFIQTRYVDRLCNKSLVCSNFFDPKFNEIINKIFDVNIDLNNFEEIPKSHHGWEFSVLSKKAFDKIMNFKKLDLFIEKCKELQPDFSDHVVFVISYLCKIPLTNCSFMTPFPSYEQYTALNKNGTFSHIHHIYEIWDQYDLFVKTIENKKEFENKKELVKYFDENLENTCWLFYFYQEKVKSRCAIRLLQDGTVEKIEIDFGKFKNQKVIYNLNHCCEDFNFIRWKKNKDEIILENDFSKIKFNKIKTKLYKSDVFDKIYILSKINPIDLVYWDHEKFIYDIHKSLS